MYEMNHCQLRCRTATAAVAGRKCQAWIWAAAETLSLSAKATCQHRVVANLPRTNGLHDKMQMLIQNVHLLQVTSTAKSWPVAM
jgi:hypothetical protein